MSTTDQKKSKLLNKDSYENVTLATGITIHTIVLLYNAMVEPNTSKEQNEILKFQLAESVLPGKKEFYEQSAEVILNATRDFLKNFLPKELEKPAED